MCCCTTAKNGAVISYYQRERIKIATAYKQHRLLIDSEGYYLLDSEDNYLTDKGY
jgi:hypothetical protein